MLLQTAHHVIRSEEQIVKLKSCFNAGNRKLPQRQCGAVEAGQEVHN